MTFFKALTNGFKFIDDWVQVLACMRVIRFIFESIVPQNLGFYP